MSKGTLKSECQCKTLPKSLYRLALTELDWTALEYIRTIQGDILNSLKNIEDLTEEKTPS